MMSAQKILTQEGYDKLVKELYELKNVRRQEIAKRIESAKELGDLSENAEYHQAKDDQAFNEGRIAELEDLMHNSVIVSKDESAEEVQLGSTITVKSDAGEKTYTIVGANEADPTNGLISIESPMAQAFLDKKKGATVEFQAPKGTLTFKIISIS